MTYILKSIRQLVFLLPLYFCFFLHQMFSQNYLKAYPAR